MNINVDGVILQNKPLTNIELMDACKMLKIPLRGVFMVDNLPKKPLKTECGIVNLDSQFSGGTHWTCYYKCGEVKCFFDSFGRVPPITLQKYLGSGIDYSTNVIQKPEQVICGHHCLHVLNRLHNSLPLKKIVHLEKIVNEFF